MWAYEIIKQVPRVWKNKQKASEGMRNQQQQHEIPHNAYTFFSTNNKFKLNGNERAK